MTAFLRGLSLTRKYALIGVVGVLLGTFLAQVFGLAASAPDLVDYLIGGLAGGIGGYVGGLIRTRLGKKS
ncbi:MAG: hypothetical protein AAF074_16070 [Pseudomonadota bacterium]